jgi:hypothetical protein
MAEPAPKVSRRADAPSRAGLAALRSFLRRRIRSLAAAQCRFPAQALQPYALAVCVLFEEIHSTRIGRQA